MVIKAFIKSLDSEGDYVIDGKVMVLPISGSGRCSFIGKDNDLTMTLKFSEVEKGGKTVFQVDSFDVDVNPARAIFNFENLFNGDKALGDNMNKFLNENHKEIVKEVKPPFTKGMSAGFILLTNQILSKINSKDIK